MIFSKCTKYFFPAIFFLLFLITSCKKTEKVSPIPIVDEKVYACDLSFLPEIRQSGIVCKNLDGAPEDMLTTLRNEGINTVRIRIWNNPTDGHSGFNEVKLFAEEIKRAGMKVWLSVHYSDFWADPGIQTKPLIWQSLLFPELKDGVYTFTKKIMSEIKPDYIQIGNEINNGFLWPEGASTNQSQFNELLGQGIRAVRESSNSTKIMLHYAGYQNAFDFFANLTNLDFDIIAISYYPLWHGKNLDSLKLNLNSIGEHYNKDLIIAETAYPFTFGYNDFTNNIIGDQSQILPDYPASPQGQANFLNKIKESIFSTEHGKGFCYWGGEWISFKGNTAKDGSSWENQALWDFKNQALPVLKVFNH